MAGSLTLPRARLTAPPSAERRAAASPHVQADWATWESRFPWTRASAPLTWERRTHPLPPTQEEASGHDVRQMASDDQHRPDDGASQASERSDSNASGWESLEGSFLDCQVNPNGPGETIGCTCGVEFDPSDAAGFMLDCDRCHRWFHGVCAGIAPDNDASVWHCADCAEEEAPPRQGVAVAPRRISGQGEEEKALLGSTEPEHDERGEVRPRRGRRKRADELDEPTSAPALLPEGRLGSDEAELCRVCRENPAGPASGASWRCKHGADRCVRCGSFWYKSNTEPSLRKERPAGTQRGGARG